MEASGLLSSCALIAALICPANVRGVATDTIATALRSPLAVSAFALPLDVPGLLARTAAARPATVDLPKPARVLGADRFQHATLAFATGTAAGLISEEPMVALATGLALGAIKEIWDASHSGAELGDLIADALGALGAAWFVSALD